MFGRKSFSPDDEIYLEASRIIDSGADQKALEAALGLKARGYPSADFLLGSIYEFGGAEVPIDLEKATAYYRQSVYKLRDDVSIVYLARAYMKRGASHYGAAYKCLRDLEALGVTARAHLAWAWYYETSPHPDLRLARRHYVRAALRGRFWGSSATRVYPGAKDNGSEPSLAMQRGSCWGLLSFCCSAPRRGFRFEDLGPYFSDEIPGVSVDATYAQPIGSPGGW